MLFLIVSLLCAVSAQTDSTQTSLAYPIYSRTYLRGLKNAENKRLQTEFINNGFAYIKNAVFNAAKQGLSHYTTDPFLGCDVYNTINELSRIGLNKENCDTIINEIKLLVSNRFPDSEIIYNINTNQYTLKWD